MNSRNVVLAALSASLLSACATGGEPFTASAAPPDRQIYYFTGFATVDKDYINRYACKDDRVTLVCSCQSRLTRSCDCRC
jgi:hypothetical protein